MEPKSQVGQKLTLFEKESLFILMMEIFMSRKNMGKKFLHQKRLFYFSLLGFFMIFILWVNQFFQN